ncbi:bifunctional 4-hydroxy-2-oxoglutarate aldolase/2-dehydro-3-deoxy-phosphogluconate aldolase [Croceitalea sp. MTPC5]|uniref:bifunctional 4-hydroxy-2-oxoglutarate aldolase/2-dehydro-3-deoxy-phosphogluconate aldolase n=1 Tax=Croceitalea sp. MTPC5 TaxID=3056565 RepID=UPI002B3C4F9F|nr:bifunctional 4-hydroxy-2-oxoglutarate aldolase/2-dehydro-3-deoxy-phosphogluconate aldolase [Croceitalea sp. MTPC5]
MAHTKEHIVAQMKRIRLVPVYHTDGITEAKTVVDFCYGAGIRVFEFVNRSDNALRTFAALREHCEQYDDFILGVGTIFNVEDAERFYDIGAQFIVSPALVKPVAHFANLNELLWIPGCGTITEVHEAKVLNTDFIKVFPANVLGTAFVKAVKSVLPKVNIMPTGGISPKKEVLDQWFDAGADCVGIGSKLFKNLEDEGSDALGKMLRHIQKMD